MARKRGRPKGNLSKPTEDPSENAGNQSKVPPRKNQKSKGGSGRGRTTVGMRLSNKPGRLTKDDIMCPICWSTLFEPTTLPCNHSLCEVCFRKHIDETSLTCPCCRLRLSIWCRKTKDSKLLDEPLWNRIKNEFPRLVQARMNGEDTQNIMDLEIERDDFIPDSPSLLNNQPPVVYDGTFCDQPGEIKAELQEMMRQHEKDMENERLREETASASLIKQIQEDEDVQRSNNQVFEKEDFLVAQKLQQELQAEEHIKPALPSNAQLKKSIQRNLVKEWNNIYSPDICDLPKSTPAKNRSSFGSNSFKGKKSIKKSSTKKKTSVTLPSTEVSKASQEVMNKFLSYSQSKILPCSFYARSQTADVTNVPCCSKSLPIQDMSFSAFSPTKPSGNFRFVPVESLAIPISSARDCESPIDSKEVDEPVTNTTPDSIKSEVERHFRPIRSAPKTPPRRRPDGTFLPEPKLLRTTPVKPSFSTVISAYIRSPLKPISVEGRPSCATIEKRISNDSGRASDDSRSPDVDGIDESPTSSFKGPDNVSLNIGQSYHNERGCPSEDYRVTPEDASRTPENSKKRFHGDGNFGSGTKKAKIKFEPMGVSCLTPNRTEHKHEVKEEFSPSLLDDSPHYVPLSFDLPCTQGVITIDEDDEEQRRMQEEAFVTFRQKAEQEAADRAYAEALQRDLNRGSASTREKYSLRSWLNPNPVAKQEVKRKGRVAK